MEVISRTDDIDGSPGAIERRFSIGELDYVIDLTEVNYAYFIAHMEPYIQASRLAKKQRVNQASVVSPEDAKKIRFWAQMNGRLTSRRGRLPNDIVRDYYATMEKTPQEFVVL